MSRLTFGVDRMPDGPMFGRTKSGSLTSNPCVRAFGPGPEGQTCKDCAHLFRVGGVSGRYLKCDLRRITSGPLTDHRSGWPACARFALQPEPTP